MDEIWKPVVGYEGIYEVSDQGNTQRIFGGRGARLGRAQKHANVKGYRTAALRKDGQLRHRYVHQLVLESFVGPKSEGTEPNHKNGDKADNRLANLEWVTRKANIRHSFEMLNHQNAQGEDHHAAKLTEENVHDIRELYATGQYSQPQLGKRFGVSHVCIGGIVRGKEWKRSGGPLSPNQRHWHLTENDVSRIRELSTSKQYSQKAIGQMFGVSQSHISDIVNGKKWRNP